MTAPLHLAAAMLLVLFERGAQVQRELPPYGRTG